MHMSRTLLAAGLLSGLAGVLPVAAEDLNIYSSRHYDTDDGLYEAFTKATGIQVNRLEGEADELNARMKAEGENSPADILMTVDAGRIWRAEQEGLLQPVESDVLEERIPAHLRDPKNEWFGLSQRARLIFYAKDRVANPPQTYEDLADPQYKGMICIRSATNIYNLSLMASIIAHDGEEAAKSWAEGLLANLARQPEGGDIDQLRGLVSGACDIAVANSYYFARTLAQNVEGVTGHTDEIGIVFPDQETNGTHVNIAAAGVAVHAKNRDNAIAFLEFMTTPEAQAYFADQNNEFPVVPGVPVGKIAASLGSFRQDTLNLDVLGENQTKAQEIFNEVGFP
ncbi:MAG: Fe(3+) ABC transporter substrate-binding protein [Rhodobacteraceae bacterium]|uniref:Fe(3+) ABC transporter substrate-binding protein n=1 Tax=Amaricoccus sp. B4 TaxID=3368557 RepID=UPI000DAC172D|nr:Fe(3+) ABC transporter substrate-binding protein [Paracoccaceae bacterium]